MRVPSPSKYETALTATLQGAELPPVDFWRKDGDLAILNRWERALWLRHALMNQDEEAVDYLLERGFAKHAKAGPSCLLWDAFGTLRADFILRLVAQGGDPNCYNRSGLPILFAALDIAYPELVKALLDGGADPGTKFREWYPLDWADQYTKPLLLAAGATMKHT